MCYIQLSLLGVAAYIKVGNTFTEPMYCSEVWTIRRLFKGKTLL